MAIRYLTIIIFLFLAWVGIVSPYSNDLDHQSETRRYNYRVTGRVIFNKHQSKRGATIYLLSNHTPLAGRIPFTQADGDGRFSFQFIDIPDDYWVFAHEGETGGLLPLVPLGEQPPSVRPKYGSSKPFQFGARDSEQRVTIKLK